MYALSTAQSHIGVPKCRPKQSAAHILVVLGSGGHTAEMFSMLRRAKLDPSIYTFRTYVVSSGDHFSATKAAEFESDFMAARPEDGSYDIVTVPRARRVHQSYLTAPFSTLRCFWACLLVLLHPDQQRPCPDAILTNGPATAVCVIMAAKLIRLFRCSSGFKASRPFQLRTIFVESWARVSMLSLSGKLLLPFVDRFLVQWPSLEGKQAWKGTRKTEYIGVLLE